jgi:digeranylgeranylglycerophospholipid reductase
MIAIIGSGPVGCYAASLLADNFKVTVFEEHKSVGLPVQCTGIVTQEIFDFIPKKNNFVVNEACNVRIFAPDNKHLDLKLEKPDITLDRQKFDNYFYNQAKNKDVSFAFNHRFIKAIGSVAFIKDLKSGRVKKFKFSHLIGADGPLSSVAKNAGLYNNRKLFIGLQAIIKKKNNNLIDFYPLKQGFGWAVPEDKNTLRVGFASEANPKEQFENLLKKYRGKIIAKQGGLIPIFNPSAPFSKQNTFLIGDAAGFVKATTGGGLIPGLKSAEILAHSIKNNVNYEAGIYFHLTPGLWLNLKMRNIMDSFSPGDWNDLIKDLNNNQSKKALQSVNRDKLFQLLLGVAVNNPRIIKHGFRHITGLF